MRKEMFNVKVKNLGIYLVNCGYEDCCPDFVCAPHIRKYYLIHYVTKGNGYYEVNGNKFSVSEGDIFIIHPNTLISYYSPDIENTWSFCWFGFGGSDAEYWLNESGINETDYIKHIMNPTLLSTVMNCVDYMSCNENSLSQVTLAGHLSAALNAISASSGSKKHSSVGQVDRAVRFIEYNYMRKITVCDICAHLGLERSYFYRIFKNYTGSSPEQYLMKYRIKKACELLKLGKYTVTEVALYTGIQDIYYFSKLFKSVVGVSPSKYAKENK